MQAKFRCRYCDQLLSNSVVSLKKMPLTDDFILTDKLDRLEYLNARSISNIAEEPLPPNLLQEGEQQILVEDGKLIFGPNIGTRNNPRRNSNPVGVNTFRR